MILYSFDYYLTIVTVLSFLFYFLIYSNRLKIGNLLKTNDFPDNDRKIHKDITPRTASYTLVIIFSIILVSNFFLEFLEKDYNLIIFISLLAFFIGLIDDRYQLKAIKKIVFLSIISILAIHFSSNLLITKIYFTSNNAFFHLDQFSILFTILCILLLTNAMNLADGINGIAISLFFYFFIYLSIISASESMMFVCCTISINLVIIFYHNYKGKHFLGDAGTLMLSTMLSLLIIKISNEKIILDANKYKFSAEQIFILFMIPGLDMFRLFLKRILKKKDPFTADKSHLHHYLINRLSLKKTLICYLILVKVPMFLSYFRIYEQKNIIIFTTLVFFMLITFLKLTNEN